MLCAYDINISQLQCTAMTLAPITAHQETHAVQTVEASVKRAAIYMLVPCAVMVKTAAAHRRPHLQIAATRIAMITPKVYRGKKS